MYFRVVRALTRLCVCPGSPAPSMLVYRCDKYQNLIALVQIIVNMLLTLVLLDPNISTFVNSVDPDQLTEEAS